MSTQNLFTDFSFRVGAALADLYLENPFAFIKPDFLNTLFDREKGIPIMKGDEKDLARSLQYMLKPGSVASQENPEYRPVQSDNVYAGLAYGLSRIYAYRVRRIYEMVATNHKEREEMNGHDQDMGTIIGQVFLHRISRGQSLMEAFRTLRHEMDSLRYGPTRPETWDAHKFPTIESLLEWITNKWKKGMAHSHMAGLEWLHELAMQFSPINTAFNATFQNLLSKHPNAPDIKNRTDPTELRRLGYVGAPDSHASFELPFLPRHAILNSDDGTYHRRLMEETVKEAAEQGTQFIGVISSFDQNNRSPEQFRQVILGSLRGILDGEKEAQAAKQSATGALLLGLHKSLSADDAKSLVQQWINLRRDLHDLRPKKENQFGGRI